MNRQRTGLMMILFVGALALAWLTHGTGVVRNDLSRNIYIPDELTMPLQVQVAYNENLIFFHFRWPARNAYVYHDMLRYEDGTWVRHGASRAGPDPDNTYEDRVTMLVDDGRVPDFGRFGGYITIGANARFFTNQADKAEVAGHPHLGGTLGVNEVQKHLPATRSDMADWRTVVSEETLQQQRDAGYFLDLWHWRAGRSNPVGMSDDQWIGEHRHGDSGKAPFSTNWDSKLKQPKYMFDPARTGQYALRWEDVESNRFDFEDIYYLSEDFAVPFDPSHSWVNGDVIPRRLLRIGDGSRGDIRVYGKGRWEQGYWNVTLVRALVTGNPDDKAFNEQGLYNLGFAVHRDATGSRWHYVSLPCTLGLGRDADITAEPFTGESPPWTDTWKEIKLFYPGQVNWPYLTSRAHAGSVNIAEGVPVHSRHTEVQLALYGVEREFNSEIIRQWIWTLVSGIVLMMALGIGLSLRLGRYNGGVR
ncbi:MAG TPA: hypothetical protein ENN34_04750 [Deltaproteobacteria bacterium]|mgnify:CR=1 FL=1|nr:hypothetical protein [Deltaproteobacteria bacterium]